MAAGFGLGPFQHFKGAAAVEHAGQLIGDGGAFGKAQLFGQRPRLVGGGGEFALQPGVGGLHGGGGGAQLFEQHRQPGGIQRRFQPGTAIGNGAAIIGKVGAAGLDTLGQRFGLVMRRLHKRGDFGGGDIAAMGTAQRRDSGKIDAAGEGRVDGQRQVMVLVADIAPEQVIDIGLRRQAGADQQGCGSDRTRRGRARAAARPWQRLPTGHPGSSSSPSRSLAGRTARAGGVKGRGGAKMVMVSRTSAGRRAAGAGSGDRTRITSLEG